MGRGLNIVTFMLLAAIVSLSNVSYGRAQQTPNELTVLVPTTPDAATQAFLSTFESLLAEADVELTSLPVSAFVQRGSDIPDLLQTSDTISMAFMPGSALLVNGDGERFTYAALMQQPAFVEDVDQNFALQDSVVGDLVATELSAVGLELISFWSRPPESLWSNVAIAGVQDLGGRKIARLQGPTAEVMVKLGANPIQLPASEVYNALQAGAADTASGNSDQWGSFGFFETRQNAFYVNNVSQEQGYLVAAESWWLGLSQATRNAITEAAEVANDVARSIVLESERNLQERTKALGVGYTSISNEGWSGLREVSEVNWLSGANPDARKDAFETLRTVQDEIRLLQDRDGAVERRGALTPEILFATNRNDEQTADLADRFGIVKNNQNQLSCGTIAYTPEPRPKLGKVFKGPLVLKDDRLWTGAEGCADFLQTVLEDDGRLTVFFHGYWNSFQDAVGRGIGIKRDLAIDGPLLVWSWPSKGTKSGYQFDVNSVQFSQRYVERFVAALDEADLLKDITIVAHSMGSKMAALMVDAFRNHGQHIDNLVFVAPDFPPSLFEQFLADNGKMQQIRSLYANEHDRALWLSEKINGETPIGRGGRYLQVLDEIETVDVSEVAKWGVTNHAHGFDVRKVVADVTVLLKDRLPAEQRSLVEYNWNGRTFWSVPAN